MKIRKIATTLMAVVFSLTGFTRPLSAELPAPESCKAAILTELSTGTVLYELNPDLRLPMASVTKIMTLLITAEEIEKGNISFSDTAVCSAYAGSMDGSVIWLEEGEEMENKKIGVLCNYIPIEIIHAAGFKTQRISILDDGISKENELPSYTCSYAKVLLNYIEEHAKEYCGFIFANSCHAMEAVYEIVRERMKDVKVHMMLIPRSTEIQFLGEYKRQINQLIEFMERNFNIAFSSDSLQKEIDIHNSGIKEMNQIKDYLMDVTKKGFSIKKMQQTYGKEHKEITLSLLEEFQVPKNIYRPRILLYGSVYSPIQLIDTIEESGGDVVYLDTCNSFLNQLGYIEESEDAMECIAKMYLEKRACGPQFSTERTIKKLMDIIEKYHVDAIVISVVKFCPDLVYGLIQIKDALKEEGYACLIIDDEYGDEVSGQIQTRIEAFIEQLDR